MTRARGATILDIVASLRVGSALVIGLALSAATARAEPDAESKARGAKLFEAARVFAKQGEFARACELFEQSYGLDPGAGTEMNLADCTEHLGQWVKAWHLFDAAALELDHDNDARAAYAHQRADKLQGALVTVIVRIAPPLPAGLVVTINHHAEAALGDIHDVVDPGPIEVVASAPDRTTITRTVDGAAGATQTIDLELVAEPAVTKPPQQQQQQPLPPPPIVVQIPVPEPRRRKAWVYTAYGMGGVGALAEVAALVVGLSARSEHDSAISDGSCKPTAAGLACTPAGTIAENSAGSTADEATAVAITGGALLIGGAIVYLVAPREREQLHVAPMAGAHVVGLTLGRAF